MRFRRQCMEMSIGELVDICQSVDWKGRWVLEQSKEIVTVKKWQREGGGRQGGPEYIRSGGWMDRYAAYRKYCVEGWMGWIGRVESNEWSAGTGGELKKRAMSRGTRPCMQRRSKRSKRSLVQGGLLRIEIRLQEQRLKKRESRNGRQASCEMPRKEEERVGGWK